MYEDWGVNGVRQLKVCGDNGGGSCLDEGAEHASAELLLVGGDDAGHCDGGDG